MTLVEGSQLLQSYPLALVQLDPTFGAESCAVESACSSCFAAESVVVSLFMKSQIKNVLTLIIIAYETT